jgi:hypothetical protein
VIERHPILAAIVLYGAIAVALTGPALLGRASLAPDELLDWDPLYRTQPPPHFPKYADLTATVIDLSRDLTIARGLHHGRFDSWNPLSGAGAPLWTEMGGPFFPLKAIVYLVPSRRSYDFFLASRLVVAGLGSFMLARRRGLSGAAALAAGAAFEISGSLLTILPHGAFSAPYMLPWVILGSFLIAERRTAAAVVGAAVALAVTAAAGHPTLTFLVFAAFGVAMLGHAMRPWRRWQQIPRLAICAVLAVALGLALAAPTVLPQAELVQAGTSYKDRPIGVRMYLMSLGISRRAALSAPLASSMLGTAPSTDAAVELTPAMGTVTLFLALTGIVAGGLDLALICVGLLGVALALAPPGLSVLGGLPGFRLILPMYAWPLVALALAQAAGSGVRALSGPGSLRAGGIALVLLLGLALALVSGAPFAARTVLPVVAAAIVLAACTLARRTWLARFVGAALVTLAIGEHVLTMRPLVLHPASAVLASPPSPAVRFLQERSAGGDARLIGIPYVVGHPLSPMLYGLADLRGYAALTVRRFHDYVIAMRAFGADLTVQEIWTAKNPLLDLAAVRYIVLPALPVPNIGPEVLLLAVYNRPSSSDPELPVVYGDERVVIHENRNALPRLRIVHRATQVPDEAAARAWADQLGRRSGSAAQLDAADVVVLEPDEHGRTAPMLSAGASADERVRLIDGDDPDRLRIEARLDAPGFVVVADTYYPGWQASVDGQPTSIYPGDLLFRAVYVPAGDHVIEFEYRPWSLRYGVALFLAAAVLCAVVLVRAGLASAAQHSLPPRETVTG